MTTQEKIIKYIKTNNQATARELIDYLNISKQALFKNHLSKLIENGTLIKIGTPPKVFYLINQKQKKEENNYDINNKTQNIINKNFIAITPAGQKKEGVTGFIYWCRKNNLPILKTVQEYIKTLDKYDIYKKNNLIDGMFKMKKTFNHIFLNKIFYLDFYSIERFGKTKLGQLLLYAKQSQDKNLIKEVIKQVEPKFNQIIKNNKIDGVCFIPPTVKRETQLMRILEKNLKGNFKKVSILKIKTPIIVPQKTLNKLSDRIENAKNTFVIDDASQFKNILLVDDAIGSGATINEIAKKIRQKNICKGKIIGLAITGSFKGFDVISEV